MILAISNACMQKGIASQWMAELAMMLQVIIIKDHQHQRPDLRRRRRHPATHRLLHRDDKRGIDQRSILLFTNSYS